MTIDSNIVIGYLNGDPKIIKTIIDWRRAGKVLVLSTVAETEILSFSAWSHNELRTTEKFLEENFASVIFDRALARITSEIRREAKIKFPDAAIAATAIFTRTALVTRNEKDFRKIAGLQIVSI